MTVRDCECLMGFVNIVRREHSAVYIQQNYKFPAKPRLQFTILLRQAEISSLQSSSVCETIMGFENALLSPWNMQVDGFITSTKQCLILGSADKCSSKNCTKSLRQTCQYIQLLYTVWLCINNSSVFSNTWTQHCISSYSFLPDCNRESLADVE